VPTSCGRTSIPNRQFHNFSTSTVAKVVKDAAYTITATAAPRRLIRRLAPSTGSSQRRHHDAAVGINHHCINATLTTWTSHTDSHGSAPNPVITGVTNLDISITMG
jgi:hypothetical protein